MQPKETLTMRDHSRYAVIRASLEGRTQVSAVASVLGVSERQVYRLRARVREEGIEGVVHRLRGSRSHRRLPGVDRLLNLICLVDDATNDIQAAWFVEHDTTIENMRVLKMCFGSRGLPWAIYFDRDSKFKTTRRGGCHIRTSPDQGETQIQRALGELGVELIHAGSPQAKGRIERDFRTLQDRLINELRLNGIESLDGANNYLWEEFIPKWNRRFRRSP